MASLMPQACARCWRRKQRCGRQLPECLKCKEAGAECIQRRMGVVLDPSQPDANSYIEGLQKRVQRLEHAARQTPNAASTPGRQVSEPADQNRVDDDTGSEKNSAMQTNGENLEATMQVMDYLPLSAMAEDRQQTSLQQYSFQTFLNAALDVSGSDPARSTESNSAQAGSIEAFYQTLVPTGLKLSHSIMDIPVQRYLSTCDVVCPYLDREDLSARYSQVMAGLEKPQADQLTSQAPHHAMIVYAAMATGILVSPDYKHSEGISTLLVQTTSRLWPLILGRSDNASVVRSLIALSIYSGYSALGGSTWHLIGLALARAMAAGMHTEGVSNCRATDPDRRENGRLFWSLYVLDANVSFALDRPFCLQDSEITTPMPLPNSKATSENSMETLASVVQYAHLLREIRRSPSMGTVFHLANYKHWKDMSMDRLTSDVSPESKDILIHGLTSMSCKLLLQIMRTADMSQHGNVFHLWSTADAEFDNLIEFYRRRAEAQDCVLTALDGLDICSITVYNVGRSRPTSVLRSCLDLLTTISERFSGIRSLRNVLYGFIDLATSNSALTEVDVFRLNQECQQPNVTVPRGLYNQMQMILMQKLDVHQTDNWNRGRRDTLPSM